MKKRKPRFLAAFLSATTLFTLFSFAPLAFAAPQLDFTATPPNEYKVYEGGMYQVDAELTGYAEDMTVKMYVKGPIGDPSEAEKLIETYTYITSGEHTFTWDGKFDGDYVLGGNFQVRFDGVDLFANTVNISHSFTVTDAAKITVNDDPQVYYSGGPDTYDVQLDLQAATTACVVWRINEQLIDAFSWTSGPHTASWNGKFGVVTASPGTYNTRFYVDAAYCGATGIAGTGNLATGSVTVVDAAQPQPTLSDLSVDPDPYDTDSGNVTLSYTLNGSLGHTEIEASVYESSAPGVVLKSWSFSIQGNGSNSLTWNGKDTGGTVVANGSYVFKVWGRDGARDVTPQQESFTIASVTPPTPPPPTPPPSGQCAGYTDVPVTHPDCDAVTYVKSIGAMTGNPDGTFAPNGLLQRDQIAKIVLETFSKYVDGTDYCGGTNPFPDVTSSAWSYQYICRGKDLGVITGYLGGEDAGYYRPGRSVNRAEFLALLLRNLSDPMPSTGSSSYVDVPTGQWYSGYAKYSYDNSLFTGSYLYPTQATTRVEVAAVIYKLYNLGKI